MASVARRGPEQLRLYKDEIALIRRELSRRGLPLNEARRAYDFVSAIGWERTFQLLEDERSEQAPDA